MEGHVFRAVGQLQVVFQGQPCGDVRFVVGDHRLQLVQSLVDFGLRGFCDVNRCDPSARRKFSIWYITGCETDIS